MIEIKSKINDLIYMLTEAREATDLGHENVFGESSGELSDYIYYLNLLTHKVIIYDKDEDKFFKNPLEDAKQVSEQSQAEPVYLPFDKLEMFSIYTCFKIIIVGA